MPPYRPTFSRFATSAFLGVALLVSLLPAAAQNRAAKQESPQARYDRLLQEGDKLVKDKEYEKAVARFGQAARIKPKNSHPHYRIAEAWQRAKEWDAAAEAARKAMELRKDWRTWTILRNCGRQYLRDKEYEKAWDVLQIGLDYRPDDLYNQDLALQALYQLGRYEEAVEIGEKALEAYCQYYEKNPKKRAVPRSFHTHMALAYFNLGRLQERIRRFEKEHGKDGQTDAQKATLCRFYAKLGEGLYNEARYEESVQVLERARNVWPSDWEPHRLYARSLRKAEDTEAAIAALRESEKRFPKNIWLLNEMATYLYGQKQYEKALEYYRKLVKENPDHRWWYDRMLNCLTELERYEEAEKALKERMAFLKEEARKKPHMLKELEDLETRNVDILDLSGILAERIEASRGLLSDQPTSASLHDRLGDFYLYQGRALLALSHHLEAAVLSGDGDNLAKHAYDLARANREAEAMPYVQAMIDHFPAHKRTLDIIERVVQMRGIRGRRRFALSEDQVAALQLAESACRRILEREDIDNEMRVDATIAALRYRYEALPNEPRIWMQARTEAADLLKDESLDDKQRSRVMVWMADIDRDRLEDSESAYRLLLEAGRLDPDRKTMDKLADVALNMTPRPDPEPLAQFIDSEPRNLNTARLRLKLVQWLWDRGDRDRAVSMLSEEVNRFQLFAKRRTDSRAQRGWDWFLDQMRNTRPELLQRAWHEGALPSGDLESAAEAELLTQEVFLTSMPDLESADPIARYRQTILSLPPEWGAIECIEVRAAARPAISRPVAFFGPTDNKEFAAQWHPTAPSITDPPQIDTLGEEEPTEETVRICLESQRDTVPHTGPTVRRSYVDEGDEANSTLFHVYVRCARPYSLALNMTRGIGAPRDIEPETGEYDAKAKTIVFPPYRPTRLDDTGTTYTFRCERPRAWGTGSIEDLFPIVDLRVDEKSTVIALDTQGDANDRECWLIDDTGHKYRFRIEVAGGGIVKPGTKANLVRRTLYRMEWGRRPW